MSLADLAQGLRAAGGILSPDVQKSLMAQDAEERAAQRQRDLFLLGKAIEGVQSGAVDPSTLPPDARQAVGVSPEAQARLLALRRTAARERFFQQPQIQDALSKGDNVS